VTNRGENVTDPPDDSGRRAALAPGAQALFQKLAGLCRPANLVDAMPETSHTLVERAQLAQREKRLADARAHWLEAIESLRRDHRPRATGERSALAGRGRAQVARR